MVNILNHINDTLNHALTAPQAEIDSYIKPSAHMKLGEMINS